MTKLKGLFKVIYVIPLLWLMGCSTTKYRNNNTYLLRKNIIESIKNNITIKFEIIDELNQNIYREQIQINKLLETSTPEIKNYILFQDEITDSKEVDKIVAELQKELYEIDKKIQNKHY